jgi:hypothetical protein
MDRSTGTHAAALLLAALLPLHAIAAQGERPLADEQARAVEEQARAKALGDGVGAREPSSRAADGDPAVDTYPDGQARTGETFRHELLESDAPPPDSRAEEERAAPDDQQVTRAILARIRQDPALRQERIIVEADGGVVHLSGWVDTVEEAQRLYDLVWELPEVERIESRLVIDPRATAAARAAEE